jgi:hypothetical protein
MRHPIANMNAAGSVAVPPLTRDFGIHEGQKKRVSLRSSEPDGLHALHDPI